MGRGLKPNKRTATVSQESPITTDEQRKMLANVQQNAANFFSSDPRRLGKLDKFDRLTMSPNEDRRYAEMRIKTKFRVIL